MRAPWFLLAVLLVSGCAEQAPSAPTTGAGPVGTPSPTLTGSPPPTASPAPSEPYRERMGEWTLVVEPGALHGLPGEAVDARFTIEGPRGARGHLAVEETWMEPTRARAPMEDGRATLSGRVYVRGEGRVSASVSLSDEEPPTTIVFDGPPMRAEGVERDVAIARYEDVSDHAPGLSVRVEGSRVTVVFAAKENATSTIDEAVSANGPLLVARDENETRLVMFVTKAYNDAVMMFPEPRRTRLEAVVEDLPAGDVRVVVLSTVSCFCVAFDPPEVHERTVSLG